MGDDGKQGPYSMARKDAGDVCFLGGERFFGAHAELRLHPDGTFEWLGVHEGAHRHPGRPGGLSWSMHLKMEGAWEEGQEEQLLLHVQRKNQHDFEQEGEIPPLMDEEEHIVLGGWRGAQDTQEVQLFAVDGWTHQQVPVTAKREEE